jgi:hypothetical protein
MSPLRRLGDRSFPRRDHALAAGDTVKIAPEQGMNRLPAGHCHNDWSLRPRLRLGSQGDEEN